MTIRVLTLNVYSPGNPEWDRRLPVLRDGIRALRPDLVALQAVAAAGFVEELAPSAAHVVLAGDFDDTPESSSIRFWTGRQSLEGMSVRYEDTWEATHGDAPGPTFDPRNPLVRTGSMPLDRGRRIDYVMVRSGTHGPTLDVVSCEQALAEPVDGGYASDHFGVIAELATPELAPANE